MQKVVGSNPISRFEKTCVAGLFRLGSRLVRLHPVGLIPDSRPTDAGRSEENVLVAGRPWLVRTQVILRARHDISDPGPVLSV
jgi:hypothetical protein